MTVPLRASLYLRVSTARQAEAYCALRRNQIVETYVEPGGRRMPDRASERAPCRRSAIASSRPSGAGPRSRRSSKSILARRHGAADLSAGPGRRRHIRADGCQEHHPAASVGAATAATISARSPSASRSRIVRSASLGQRATCVRRSPPPRA
jgi:hypothetical protein